MNNTYSQCKKKETKINTKNKKLIFFICNLYKLQKSKTKLDTSVNIYL